MVKTATSTVNGRERNIPLFCRNSGALFFLFGATPPRWGGGRFLDHTQRRITVGRTPLDEWSARRRDYLTTHNTHNRQTSMPPMGFEPTILAGERPQTHALDRGGTGTGILLRYILHKMFCVLSEFYVISPSLVFVHFLFLHCTGAECYLILRMINKYCSLSHNT